MVNSEIAGDMSRDFIRSFEQDFDYTDASFDRPRKLARECAEEMFDSFLYAVEDRLAANIQEKIRRCAEYAIEAVLKGDDKELRRWLSAQEHGYNGRERDNNVIHGTLFEPGCMELRRKIVEAHADLLKNERILDLENQLESVRKQVVDLENECERLRDRLIA